MMRAANSEKSRDSERTSMVSRAVLHAGKNGRRASRSISAKKTGLLFCGAFACRLHRDAIAFMFL